MSNTIPNQETVQCGQLHGRVADGKTDVVILEAPCQLGRLQVMSEPTPQPAAAALAELRRLHRLGRLEFAVALRGAGRKPCLEARDAGDGGRLLVFRYQAREPACYDAAVFNAALDLDPPDPQEAAS